MLEHHNDSFISMLMEPCYNHCNSEGGTRKFILATSLLVINRISGSGSDKRRKSHMEDHLRNSRLFSKYSIHAKNVYGGLMAESLGSLQEKIDNQIEGIVLDFQAVVVNEGEIPEAERAPALANELRSLIRSGQATIDDTKGFAQQLNARSD